MTDEVGMARALELARLGTALAHPNPLVGAVIIKRDRVLGEGFHTYDGRQHGEVLALAKAGSRASGSTLYVNLEPCCHFGRTGPCTKAILAAGVRRVVTAMKDPNPSVAGAGIRELRRAGVEVDVGVMGDEARRLNEAFACWIRARRPMVTLKTALTLDGRIASPGGSVTWITSPESRQEVQRLRHASDALLTGIGTVLVDDPRLTDRTGLPRRRPLLRVVVDSRLRMPLRSKIVKSVNGDVLVFTTKSPNAVRASQLERAGVEIVQVRSRNGHADLREVIRELGRRQILSVLLEAGSALNAAALEAGIVDKMVLFYAPKVFGSSAVPAVSALAREPKGKPVLKNVTLRRFGPDFSAEGYLRDIYPSRHGK